MEYQDTSREAYEGVKPSIASVEATIMTALPATCDEIEHEFGFLHQTASAVIRGLVLKNMAYNTKEKRLTRRGTKAFVWAKNPFLS